MHQISLESFEGPLDLLLQLIERNKLQITEISLAQVTDQYLAYIENQDSLPSAEVADFLLIASKLIYLKSRYLLPDLNLGDEDEVGSLERQLKIYRQYYEASKKINRLYNSKKRYAFIRSVSYKRALSQEFRPPANISLKIMSSLFKDVLGSVNRIVNLPKVVMARAMSIGEKIGHLRDMIKSSRNFDFSRLIKDKKDKVEIVVSFLAMLELVKQKEIVVNQNEMFGNLNIKKSE